MKRFHLYKKEQKEEHAYLQSLFAELRKSIKLPEALKETIHTRLMEHIEDSLTEQETLSSVFQQAKQYIPLEKNIVAGAKLALFDRIEAYKPSPSFRTYLRRTFFQIAGYALSLVLVISLTSLLLVSNLQPSKAQYVGELVIRQGDAYIVRSSTKFQVKSGEKVLPGDVIEVGESGSVDISFYQERTTNLHSNTKLKVEKSNESEDIILSLEKGKIETRPSVTASDKGLLTVNTALGTVKAPEDSAFTLELDPSAKQASLKVDKSEVELLSKNNEKDPSDTSPLIAVSVASGEEKLMSLPEATNIATFTGEIIAFDSLEDFAQEATRKTNANTNSKVSTGQVVQKRSQTILEETSQQNQNVGIELPSVKGMNVHGTIRLQEAATDVEIATIKFKQLLEKIGANNSEATLIARGYVDTIGRVSDTISASMENASKNARKNKDTVSDVLLASDTPSLLENLSALSKDLPEGEKNPAYQSVKHSLEELYALESAVIIHSSLSENDDEQKDQEEGTLSLHTLDSSLGYNTKQQIESVVEQDVISRVDTVIANENSEIRAELFLSLLNSIPNEKRHLALLQKLQIKVPEDLKGFVSVKIHSIQNQVSK